MATVDDAAERLDEIFNVLADRRRRAIIDVLRTTPRGQMDRETLVDAIETLYSESEATRREIDVAVDHVHLPKLHEADIVEYDREAGEVEYRSSPLIERCLDVTEQQRHGEWVRRSPASP